MMFAFAANPPAIVATVETLTLPAYSRITVELIDGLNTKVVKEGDPFAYRVTEDVVAGGRVLIPAMTRGLGIVARVIPARYHGHPGRILLEARTIALPSGDVQVTIEREVSELQREAAHRHDPLYSRWVPHYGTGGQVFDYFSAGKEANYPARTWFVVRTLAAVRLPVLGIAKPYVP